MGSGSIAFDRAAEYYDRTRVLPPEAERTTIALLVRELLARGRCLEVGVGTGLIGLPLHAAGVDLTGLDLSAPMLAKLVQKADGRPPFALVRGDATQLPFGDHVFGGALFRHVLHLIPAWDRAVGEMVRTIRPGGVVLANLGGYGGPMDEIQSRFAEVARISIAPAGLEWDDWETLAAAFARHGAGERVLGAIPLVGRRPLGGFIDGIDQAVYSWTWSIPDDVRLPAAAAVRAWAAERFGPLDRPFEYWGETVWRAYDLA
jgi:SAM-dependent methyltransferase